MVAARVNVPLDDRELTGLVRMSEADCRHPREQMRFLLREELQKRGLLAVDRREQVIGEEHADTEPAHA